MAIGLLSYEVADLCIGKPPLRALSGAASIADALAAIKVSDDNAISVWSCEHSSAKINPPNCLCVGKICMVDIICYLCKEENLSSPGAALRSPVTVLLSKAAGIVRHVEPSTSLVEAIDLMLEGAQNLVVPIKSRNRRKQLPRSSTLPPTVTPHCSQEFCWLTQEDVIRFFLSSVALFSPIPSRSVESLGIILSDFPAINYHSPATSALGLISTSLMDQTSVAVVDSRGTLIGEISPFTLLTCDESVSAAIMTLSAGDLMAYIDCGGPPEEIVKKVEEELKRKKLEGMLEELLLIDDEKPVTYSRPSSYSVRMVRRAEAIVCHPWSSLVAVMVQALAHRVNYVWVIEDDSTVVGIVTFTEMLRAFHSNLEPLLI